MKKTFKEFLTAKGITEEQFSKKEVSEMASLHNEYTAELIKGLEEKGATKEELTELKAKLETLSTKEDFNTLTEKMDSIALEFGEMKEKGGSPNGDNFVEELKEVKKGFMSKIRTGEVELKAISNRASIVNNTDSLTIPSIGQLGTKERSLYNIFPKIPVGNGNHNGKVRYHDWDEATTVRAAAMVAEGGTFPESTAKFQEYSLDLKKVGDSLPVTEEFFEDEVSAAGELRLFLDTNVNTKIDDQIANGDGTGQNLTGLITSAPAYTPVASGITGANIYDLVKKVRTDITKTRGSKYRPDFVVMNADTIDRLQLEKDSNENYIFPDKSNIGAMIIIEDNNIPDNQLVVGDRRYGRIYEKSGVVLSEDRVNNQFLEDSMTIKARKRLLFLIRTVDKTGFRKVTNITTALTTLAS